MKARPLACMDFHKIRYKLYAVIGHLNVVFFNFQQIVMTT
jgi:hypothetical protein